MLMRGPANLLCQMVRLFASRLTTLKVKTLAVCVSELSMCHVKGEEEDAIL